MHSSAREMSVRSVFLNVTVTGRAYDNNYSSCLIKPKYPMNGRPLKLLSCPIIRLNARAVPIDRARAVSVKSFYTVLRIQRYSSTQCTRARINYITVERDNIGWLRWVRTYYSHTHHYHNSCVVRCLFIRASTRRAQTLFTVPPVLLRALVMLCAAACLS